tara:strand:- start:1076 stop:1924 length:849 start_codon:yes stop_codon:yes gene_type:complete
MRIALGTVQWGLKYGIANTKGIPGDQELKSIMTIAQENNITLLDTAAQYGCAEERIGQILTPDHKIITKISSFTDENSINDQIQNSIKNLKADNIYGCMFHTGYDLIKNKNLWGELLKYKESGVIQKIGYSLYDPSFLVKLLEANFIPDIIQLPYSVLDRKFEPYFNLLKKNNVEIHVRSIFLQGLFFKPINRLDFKFRDLKKPLKELQNIAKKYKLSTLDLALCFALQNPLIDYVVLGVETAKQLKEIIAASKQNLSKKILKEIKAIQPKNLTILNPVNWK